MSSRSLLVMPNDAGKPLLDAIAGAKKSIRIKIFLFSDPSLLAAVIAAHQRGVKIRVMLNPARRGGEPENEATRKALEDAGVEVPTATRPSTLPTKNRWSWTTRPLSSSLSTGNQEPYGDP